MSWKITVQFDPDQNDVGSVSATWTDPNPALPAFTHSKRVKGTLAGVNAFVAEAVAARDAWQTKQQANITGAAFVLNKINAADPKVGV